MASTTVPWPEDGDSFIGDVSLPLTESSMLPVAKRAVSMDGKADASTAPPPSETASEGGYAVARSGFTLRNLEEELHKLKNANLHLKLRIYQMEERWRQVQEPVGKTENVYR